MFLEDVLGSKGKIKILRVLLERATAYTREELEEETGLSTGAVHEALKELVRTGLVTELKGEGKQRFYKIRREGGDILAKNLSDLFEHEKFSERKEAVPVHHWNRLAEVVRRLRAMLDGRLSLVVLFGSLARGDVTPRSDVDLLLVLREMPDESIRGVRSELRKGWDVDFSLVPRSLEQFEEMKREGTSLFEEVQRDGVVLFHSEDSPELTV